ncbi:MAG: hypothetical protein HYZ14_15810 [Bacteroidetes bacterium]|nr:hypothetical protein [Bacteroidota bacterium]
MELEEKAEEIVDEIDKSFNLDTFNRKLQSRLYEIHRDEYKLKLLDFVTKEIKDKMDKHKADGSCQRRYPNGGCPQDKKCISAFAYIEQEYDKIVNDINIYGTLNRYNAHVFGETFSIERKKEIETDLEQIVISGNIELLKGQQELSQQITNGFEELKPLLHLLNKKNWVELLKGQIYAAGIGLAINPENLKKLISEILTQLKIES